MDDVKWKPRGEGAGGGTNLWTQHVHVNANVETPKDPKVEQRFLDAVDRLLVPQNDRERGALEDKGRKASVLEPSATLSTEQFGAMLRRTIEKEQAYLLSDHPHTLDDPGRRIHGHRISAFLHEASQRASELYSADPAAHGAALHEITFHGVSLYSALNLPGYREGNNAQLAGLTEQQRSAWLSPPSASDPSGGAQYARVGLRSAGGEGFFIDPSRVGFEIRDLRTAKPDRSLADIVALARTLLEGGKKP